MPFGMVFPLLFTWLFRYPKMVMMTSNMVFFGWKMQFLDQRIISNRCHLMWWRWLYFLPLLFIAYALLLFLYIFIIFFVSKSQWLQSERLFRFWGFFGELFASIWNKNTRFLLRKYAKFGMEIAKISHTKWKQWTFVLSFSFVLQVVTDSISCVEIFNLFVSKSN